MTPVGHVLAGVAIGVLCMPDFAYRRHRFKHLALFAGAATLPDWPFPCWGHVRYDISHSLFVTILSILIFAMIYSLTASGRDGRGWNFFGCIALAWLSHLLLDSFYNHGYGVAIYYPFSQGRLILPVPWLSVAIDPRHPFTNDNLRIVILECLTFSPCITVTLVMRHLRGRLRPHQLPPQSLRPQNLGAQNLGA